MTAQHPALLELDKHVIVFVPGFLSSITADGNLCSDERNAAHPAAIFGRHGKPLANAAVGLLIEMQFPDL